VSASPPKSSPPAFAAGPVPWVRGRYQASFGPVAAGVREGERARGVEPDLHAAAERQANAVEPVGERLAGEVLEDHERCAAVLVDADVEDRHDRRMGHLRGGLRLALEALEEGGPHAAALLLR